MSILVPTAVFLVVQPATPNASISGALTSIQSPKTRTRFEIGFGAWRWSLVLVVKSMSLSGVGGRWTKTVQNNHLYLQISVIKKVELARVGEDDVEKKVKVVVGAMPGDAVCHF